MLNAIQASDVVPAMLVLAAQDAPNRTILCAGAGSFEASHISLTQGLFLGRGENVDDELMARLQEVKNTMNQSRCLFFHLHAFTTNIVFYKKSKRLLSGHKYHIIVKTTLKNYIMNFCKDSRI
jgi:hypothetical protein